ncbi:MAG TPA: phosphoribosyltransferase family protein [Acidimicrobiia bacterium]|nr:phosphoribosyltransferase family protein [Acidimicrobiia bacterium]
MVFEDRRQAGRELARALRARHVAGADVVVLGLPRGGVVVAREVADELRAPLDVILVRKLGVPMQPELAMGAIGEGGVRVLNDAVVRETRVSTDDVAMTESRERVELERRAREYRGDRDPIPLAGRVAVIVDDGIATGSTMRAACEVARRHGAARVVVAAPVAAPSTIRALGDVTDEIVVVDAPPRFWAIGEFYRDFRATSDDEVRAALREHRPDQYAQRPTKG